MAETWTGLIRCIVFLFGGWAVFFSIAQDTSDSGDVTVSTPYGDVKGRAQNPMYPDVVQFLGIPFAQAPVGDRRFSRPEPPIKWTGVRDAFDFGNECIQSYLSSSAFENRTQDEDCLYLNVYTPNVRPSNGYLSVMVWIHGGSYNIGAGSRYDGTALASKGVVVITINYRLDIFGFLSTETDVIPGNYGMLDQIQALKWVQESVAAFGGDPHSVTVFGESAGSGAVSLLVLSPLSQGLFHRAIMQSGVSLGPWVIDHPATRMSPRIMANLIGTLVGCTQWDQHQLLACFRRVDAEALHNATTKISWGADAGTVMAPRVENVFGVIPDLPINLLKKEAYNKVDTLRGYDTDESGGSVSDWDNDGLTIEEFRTNLISSFSPYAFTDKDQLIQKMAEVYIGNSTDPLAIRQATIRARSDVSVIGATLNEIQMVTSAATQNKHYLFEFHHRPSYSQSSPWLNALHFQEIPFVFGIDLEASQLFGGTPNDADRIVSEQMLTLWTNFAKYGDPTRTLSKGGVKWDPYTMAAPSYLQIGEVSEQKVFTDQQRVDMYYKIIQKLDTVIDPLDIIG